MDEEWISRSRAKKKWDITDYQIARAVKDGLIAIKTKEQATRTIMLLKKEDLEKNIEKIQAYPSRQWIYITEAVNRFGLTYGQLHQAIDAGQLEANRSKHFTLINVEDIEKKLDKLRDTPEIHWITVKRALYEYDLTKKQLEWAIENDIVATKTFTTRKKVVELISSNDIEKNLDTIKSYWDSSESRKKSEIKWETYYGALKHYELNENQLECAIRDGLVLAENIGSSIKPHLVVNINDIEANLEKIKQYKVKKWIYKSTAKRQFQLTEYQIELAILDGLVEARYVQHPYYRSKEATLVQMTDIEEHLEKIRTYPKTNPEKQRYYRERKKLRDKLEFFCPRCQDRIRARRDSKMFEACFENEVSPKVAQQVLILAHYRHVHTNYEVLLYETKEKRQEMYNELRRETDRELAKMMASDMIQFEIERIRAQFNKIALDLIRQDNLISEEDIQSLMRFVQV